MNKIRTYNKLVRDKIPEIIKANRETPTIKILDDNEYWKYLIQKDEEELREVAGAETLEERKAELADKLEVIRAMAEHSGFSLQDIIDAADEKKAERGGFSKKIFLIKVEG